MTGRTAETESGELLEVRESGDGSTTVTAGVPVVATSAAGTVAWISVLEVVTEIRLTPFSCTTEEGRKLAPVTVSLKSGEPAVTDAGVMDVMLGLGVAAGAAVLVPELVEGEDEPQPERTGRNVQQANRTGHAFARRRDRRGSTSRS